MPNALYADGALRWKQSHWSERSSGTVNTIVLDGAGHFYASGRLGTNMGNAIDLGGEPLDGTMFIGKFGADGHHIWTRSVNDTPRGPAIGGYLGLDAVQRIVWANQDVYSVHLRTYDSESHLLWDRVVPVKAPPPIIQQGAVIFPGWGLFGFAMRPDGVMAIGGSFAGTIDLGYGPLSSSTDWDGYFAVYGP